MTRDPIYGLEQARSGRGRSDQAAMGKSGSVGGWDRGRRGRLVTNGLEMSRAIRTSMVPILSRSMTLPTRPDGRLRRYCLVVVGTVSMVCPVRGVPGGQWVPTGSGGACRRRTGRRACPAPTTSPVMPEPGVWHHPGPAGPGPGGPPVGRRRRGRRGGFSGTRAGARAGPGGRGTPPVPECWCGRAWCGRLREDARTGFPCLMTWALR